jgi:hypothetical protein
VRKKNKTMYPNFEKFTLMKQTETITTDSTCNKALLSASLPMRIQRTRKKGFKMPENTVYVGRGSKWGNPFKVGEKFIQPDGEEIILDNQQSVNLYDQSINFYALPVSKKEIIDELKGKNLACWCAKDKPCHADLLLAWANWHLTVNG